MGVVGPKSRYDFWIEPVSHVIFSPARTKLRQAYEFSLDHIGIDFHSTSLWNEYITFLKAE